MRRNRISRLALVALLSTALAGCGSTVATGSRAGTTAGADGISSGIGREESPLSRSSSPLVATGMPQGPSGVAASLSPLPGRAKAKTPVGVQPPGGSARGPVEVGILVVANGQSYVSAFGASIDLGDPVAQSAAAVKAANATGGLAGRPIKPVIGYFDATDTRSYAVQLQGICALWTQDHHVVAAIVPAGINLQPSDLAGCLSKAGVPLINPSFFANDATDFAQYPMLINTAGFNISRLSETLVAELQRQGFFSKDARIGLLGYELPQVQRAVTNDLGPALARRGQRIIDDVRVQYPSSNADNGAAVAAISNAVLRFKSNNINRVLFLAPGAAIFFMQTAESQLYRPRYGITSYEEPTLLLTGSSAPPAQLANAQGMGWFPLLDVDDAHDPGANPPAQRCRRAMEAGDVRITARSQALAAYSYCDGLSALQLAAAASPRLDGPSLIRAFDAASSNYQSPLMLATRLGPGRHDGADGFRQLVYASSCSCFTYVGPTRRPIS